MFSISLESCEVNKFREEALKFVDKVNTVLYPINGICLIFQTVGVVSNRTIGANLVILYLSVVDFFSPVRMICL